MIRPYHNLPSGVTPCPHVARIPAGGSSMRRRSGPSVPPTPHCASSGGRHLPRCSRWRRASVRHMCSTGPATGRRSCCCTAPVPPRSSGTRSSRAWPGVRCTPSTRSASRAAACSAPRSATRAISPTGSKTPSRASASTASISSAPPMAAGWPSTRRSTRRAGSPRSASLNRPGSRGSARGSSSGPSRAGSPVSPPRRSGAEQPSGFACVSSTTSRCGGWRCSPTGSTAATTHRDPAFRRRAAVGQHSDPAPAGREERAARRPPGPRPHFLAHARPGGRDRPRRWPQAALRPGDEVSRRVLGFVATHETENSG